MLRTLIFMCLLLGYHTSVYAQIKEIRRDAAQLNYEAYTLMNEGRHKDALILLNQAIKEEPKAYFAYQNRALCRLQLNDTLGAISDLEVNVKLDPRNPDSRYALGNIHKKRQNSKLASHYFQSSLQLADSTFSNKKKLFMAKYLGRYFREKLEPDSALVYYSMVTNWKPHNASAHINVALCHYDRDSMDLFCENLEKAFILGAEINCLALKALCKGCSHLLEQREVETDTLSRVLDARLKDILYNSRYGIRLGTHSAFGSSPNTNNSLKRIYFNHLWQICPAKNACYYREGEWSEHTNFFEGNYADYYLDRTMYAKGTISAGKLSGSYTTFYEDGSTKLDALFEQGIPSGNWTYLDQNGNIDFEVQFSQNDFKLIFSDSGSGSFDTSKGTGKFEIILDEWITIRIILRGEYKNWKRHGTWSILKNKTVIISEIYKNDQFKTGLRMNETGQKSLIYNKTITPHTFIPMNIIQVNGLHFESALAVKNYPFIKLQNF